MEKQKIIEITTTLEKIDETNKMISFHRQFDQPDTNAIENFEQLRIDFLNQLAQLLREYHVEIKLPKAV
ncbi:MAG: hypothetical protein RIG62_25735 [Cyclobacteriaceae bacterium]